MMENIPLIMEGRAGRHGNPENIMDPQAAARELTGRKTCLPVQCQYPVWYFRVAAGDREGGTLVLLPSFLTFSFSLEGDWGRQTSFLRHGVWPVAGWAGRAGRQRKAGSGQ